MTSLGFWPALGDVAGAADNILRLWNVYELKVKDIINGEIASTMSRPMKKNEIEFITQTAKNLEMVYYHLSLLSELYNRTEDEAEKENYRKRLNKEYYLVCFSKLFKWMLKHHISQILKEIFIIGIMVLIWSGIGVCRYIYGHQSHNELILTSILFSDEELTQLYRFLQFGFKMKLI